MTPLEYRKNSSRTFDQLILKETKLILLEKKEQVITLKFFSVH